MRPNLQPTLGQLRLLPDDAQVTWLRSVPEGQWLERKGSRVRGRAIGDVMVGLANAEGGLICIGIADGTVTGIDGDARLINEWRQAAIDFTVPPIRHTFELVEATSTEGLPDHLVLIEVQASDRVHETRAGETFLRVGDENRKLGPFQIQELRYDKGESTFDGDATRTRLSDLDDKSVGRYARAVRAGERAEVALRARGMTVADDTEDVPTVAGLLVLGRDPQAIMPEAFLRLIRYQGTTRETGARSNITRDVRIDGPLPRQIVEGRRVLRRWLPRATRLGTRGTFAATTIIPEPAWLEAIVNSVIHRSYAIGGDHIRVELFDDRLEVESPGRLPGLVRPDNIRTTRFARNPRIARAMADLDYGRELGEGVDRMYHEMERAGLPDPILHPGPASLRVVFLADPLAARVLARLPAGSERFAEHLARTGQVTTIEAVDLLGVSRPTALTYLRRLADADLIEAVRMSPNDPRGFWRLRRAR